MLPGGENDVSVVVIVPEILKSSTSAFSNADLYERCKHVQVVPNEVRERLNKNNNKNKEISRSGLCVSGRISPKRWKIFEFCFHYWQGQESGYLLPRRSRDRWMTLKQRFLDVSSNSEIILKKITEGHATVVGGQATVVWLSNNVFWRFKQFEIFWKKSLNSHATVVGGHATVGWLSTTFFGVSSNLENFWKKSLKVTRQWSEVTRPLDDCQTTFLDVSSNLKIFWKKSLKVTRQWSEVTRPLDDCKTTFFRRFKRFGKFLKKVTEGHATVAGGHATVVWLSNNVFLTFQAIRKNLEKSHWRSRDSGRRSRDRWMTVKQRFLDVSSI